MRLTVLGASGGVGAHVVTQAQARGHDVVAVVRPSSPWQPPPHVEVVRTELAAADAALPDLVGRDAVISCLGLRRRSALNPWSALTSPRDLCAQVARRLVAAMTEAGVRRVLAVSAAGVGDSAPAMNAVIRTLVATSSIGDAYRDLAEMERVLAASTLDWLCVRPVTLTDDAVDDAASVSLVDRYGLASRIPRAMVAAYLLDRAEDPAAFSLHTPMVAAVTSRSRPTSATRSSPSA